MNKTNPATDSFQAKTRKNTLKLGAWTATWVASTALATFGPQFIWDSSKTLTTLALLVNVIVGVCMILANKQHLHGLDELQQRIQLEAMAIALGLGLVFGLAYSMADTTNLIPAAAEISYLVMFIGLTYLISVIVGQRKYR
ncbi:MAG: hypothetical protein K0U72_15535 [Gammaproteobacteria bacterium]|nr:hypothetical protein [Gammaproteobacteria bacterium]